MKSLDDIVLGALNVYSDSVDAFSAATGSSLGAFVAQATTSLFLLGELQNSATRAPTSLSSRERCRAGY